MSNSIEQKSHKCSWANFTLLISKDPLLWNSFQCIAFQLVQIHFQQNSRNSSARQQNSQHSGHIRYSTRLVHLLLHLHVRLLLQLRLIYVMHTVPLQFLYDCNMKL